ncbi:hypothetical protein [Clostridium butyricum]|uniref:hypothetical protein n=1 Tax=Clostridium butyricum TaxID=1492 RepID=UPI002ABDA6D9|nr:hypothetical protein [Clostridium butyricum]
MRKKINILLVFILVLLNSLIIPISSVKAQTLSDLTVKANISEQNSFKGEIELFIKDSTGIKRVFSLDANNSFSCTHSLPVGRCTLEEMKIFDSTNEDKNREPISLPHSYDGKLNVVENEKSIFTINIDNSESYEKESEIQKKDEKEPNSNDSNSKSNKSSIYASLSKVNLVLDIVLIIGVGSVVLYFKKKDKKE